MSQLIRYTIHIILAVIYVPGHWHPLWLCPLADTHTHRRTHSHTERLSRATYAYGTLLCANKDASKNAPGHLLVPIMIYYYVVLWEIPSLSLFLSLSLLAWKYFDRGLRAGFLCGKITPSLRLKIKRCGSSKMGWETYLLEMLLGKWVEGILNQNSAIIK